MEEIFKDISFNGYHVSNLGNVRRNGKILKPGLVSTGYCSVGLCDGKGVSKTQYIHRLVAMHFLDPPDDPLKCIVDHIDQNKANNCVQNLRWVTHRENCNNRGNTREPTPAVLKQREYSRLYRLANPDKFKQYQTVFRESGNKNMYMKKGRVASREFLLSQKT